MTTLTTLILLQVGMYPYDITNHDSKNNLRIRRNKNSAHVYGNEISKGFLLWLGQDRFQIK